MVPCCFLTLSGMDTYFLGNYNVFVISLKLPVCRQVALKKHSLPYDTIAHYQKIDRGRQHQHCKGHFYTKEYVVVVASNMVAPFFKIHTGFLPIPVKNVYFKPSDS